MLFVSPFFSGGGGPFMLCFLVLFLFSLLILYVFCFCYSYFLLWGEFFFVFFLLVFVPFCDFYYVGSCCFICVCLCFCFCSSPILRILSFSLLFFSMFYRASEVVANRDEVRHKEGNQRKTPHF